MEPLEENDDALTNRAKGRVGERLRDKWLLDELLGVGGMAAVYAATHRNGKRVAIKILHREVAVSEDSRARFLREGYVANAVEHKGAVSVLDEDVTEDGAPFFVMELFAGETLDQRLRRKGPLEVEEVLSTTYHLLDVLAAAHDKGIVHRDVKPENVFLTKDAAVKVLDFGIAQLRQGATSTTTKVGHTMGTPSFMSPEQARGRWDEVDARSDVWAVGATMFTLLTGKHVHEAETMNEVLLGAMTSPAKPVALYRPELPKGVCDVVDRALAFDKASRWESAAAMQAAIKKAYGDIKRTSDDWARAPTLMATSVREADLAALPPAPTPPTTTARPTARTASVSDAPVPPPPRRRKKSTLLVTAAAMVFAFGGWAVLARGPAGVPVSGAQGATAQAAETSAAPPVYDPPPPETVDTSNAIGSTAPSAAETAGATLAPPAPVPVAAVAAVVQKPRPAPRPAHVTPPPPPPVVPTGNPLDRRH